MKKFRVFALRPLIARQASKAAGFWHQFLRALPLALFWIEGAFNG